MQLPLKLLVPQETYKYPREVCDITCITLTEGTCLDYGTASDVIDTSTFTKILGNHVK